MNGVSKKLYCPLMKRDIEVGYCWELCNIGSDEMLLEGDIVEDWKEAEHICMEVCGLYND